MLVLTSKQYDSNKVRPNSYVEYFNNDQITAYGQILYFVEKQDGEYYCLVKAFSVIHERVLIHVASRLSMSNFIPFKETTDMTVSISNVKSKVIEVGQYLCKRVNTHEKKL